VLELIQAASFDYLVSGNAGAVGDCGAMQGQRIPYRVMDVLDSYAGIAWHWPRSLAELSAVIVKPSSLLEIRRTAAIFIYQRDMTCSQI
jgi:hypothetical protein